MKNAQQKVTIWHSPTLSGLTTIFGQHVTAGTPRHFHDAYQISFVERGAIDLYDSMGRTQAMTNEVFCYRPHDVHAAQPLGDHGWDGLTLHIEASTLESLSPSGTFNFQFAPVLPVNPALQTAFLKLRASMSDGTASLEQEAHLLSIITSLNASKRNDRVERSRASEAVRRVCDYLHAHYANNVDLDTLAALAHMSKFHLAHIFQNQVGIPPHAYLTQIRLARAKQLLRQGRSVSAIANECGFTHSSHLTRYFRRFFGVSPGQYFSGSQ